MWGENNKPVGAQRVYAIKQQMILRLCISPHLEYTSLKNHNYCEKRTVYIIYNYNYSVL